MYKYFMPSYSQIICHCMDILHCQNPCVRWWAVYLLAIMNNTATDINVHVSVWTYTFINLGHIPRSGIARSHGNCLIVWETTRLFSQVATPFYIPNSSKWRFWFLHVFAKPCYYLTFSLYPILWVWRSISLWVWFAFPWRILMLSIFSGAY